MSYWLAIVVAAPAYSAIAGPLTYSSQQLLEAGQLVRVPLGAREVLGVVWKVLDGPGDLPPKQARTVAGVLADLTPLSCHWRQLIAFTASYYQRSLGEVALAALPPQLRTLGAVQLARRLKRRPEKPGGEANAPVLRGLSQDQTKALDDFQADIRPALLFGVTGSGKTEVYLRAAARVLATDAHAQVLVMVPEINLTPQLQGRFQERFSHLGPESVVSLHSGLTPAQRLKSWLAAHAGVAKLVLGTRMAVLASMPHLRLIVVDEEHDPSYKQQEGARYSARDLAVYRAWLESTPAAPCRVMLGSATPSLETWQATRTGRYQRLDLSERIQALPAAPQPGASLSGLPQVCLINMRLQPRHCTLAPPLVEAIGQRIARGEQSLVFLNRRGYAPVLACHECNWKSQCQHCSAFRVFHKTDRTLRCHHCGWTDPVPRSCPGCGNRDIMPVGRGTERLEEELAQLLSAVRRPDGSALRIARIDADSTRAKGALEKQLNLVHAGDVDVLVGTQMIAKGHDFRNITLVAAVNPDGALFSSDFRAPERLFGLLMQAAGRAGRAAEHSTASQMWIQTFYPDHALFAALKKHDYAAFAAQELAHRQAAQLAPFGFSALVRAEARTQDVAQGFLNAAAATAQAQDLTGQGLITLYPAVPMSMQRVANTERAQMLVESHSRSALQRFLPAWQPILQATHQQTAYKPLMRWAMDVDPLAI